MRAAHGNAVEAVRARTQVGATTAAVPAFADEPAALTRLACNLGELTMRAETRATAPLPWHPVLALLTAFPIAGFCGALLTDIAYALTANMLWADFSAWLLAVGMVFGGLAAIVGICIFIAGARRSGARPGWQLALGSLVVLLIGLLDNLVHSRDAWTSVVPLGLALSAVNVVVIVVTAVSGAYVVFRRGTTLAYSEVRP